MAQVLLTPLAEADLDNIWDYIADDSPDRATEFLLLINEKLDMLASSPLIGRVREELAPELRSFPVKKYIIFYQAITGGIEVIRILHGSQDIANILDIEP